MTRKDSGEVDEFSQSVPLTFRIAIEEHEDRPNRWTVFPVGSTGFELMSTWITACESDFVALDSMR